MGRKTRLETDMYVMCYEYLSCGLGLYQFSLLLHSTFPCERTCWNAAAPAFLNIGSPPTGIMHF